MGRAKLMCAPWGPETEEASSVVTGLNCFPPLSSLRLVDERRRRRRRSPGSSRLGECRLLLDAIVRAGDSGVARDLRCTLLDVPDPVDPCRAETLIAVHRPPWPHGVIVWCFGWQVREGFPFLRENPSADMTWPPLLSFLRNHSSMWSSSHVRSELELRSIRNSG
ncbi:hypothetical protein VTK26DRAFT_2455 [Humicola hyalothermophila]